MTHTLEQLDRALVRAREEHPPMRTHGEILHSVFRETREPPEIWASLAPFEKQFWQDQAAAFRRAVHEESTQWLLRYSPLEPFHLMTNRWYARCVRFMLGKWIPARKATPRRG